MNQRIGGGTWLYLGTFRFKKGQTPQGMVTLDNSSSTRGTVNADAVRFGGGMARETRAGLDVEIERYNIGSRYYTRFAGAPDSIYNKYDGADDYREDIWTRPYMTNWVSGGSVVKVHSDDTIELCLDGEMLPGKDFRIEIIPQAISFIIPA